MVEQQPSIFKEVSKNVNAIEECAMTCRPLDDRCLIPVAVAASLGADLYPELDAGVQPSHHYHRGHCLLEYNAAFGGDDGD
jgi:hypothetical protein